MTYYKPNPFAAKVKENALNKVLEIMEKTKKRLSDYTSESADSNTFIIDYEKLEEEIYKIW